MTVSSSFFETELFEYSVHHYHSFSD